MNLYNRDRNRNFNMDNFMEQGKQIQKQNDLQKQKEERIKNLRKQRQNQYMPPQQPQHDRDQLEIDQIMNLQEDKKEEKKKEKKSRLGKKTFFDPRTGEYVKSLDDVHYDENATDIENIYDNFIQWQQEEEQKQYQGLWGKAKKFGNVMQNINNIATGLIMIQGVWNNVLYNRFLRNILRGNQNN